jgi:AcrR family transcriptional regulator
MKQLTWSDFDQFQPCYSPQEKYGDFNGTILDILNDERIPDNDKIWAATCKGILPDYVNRKFATQCCRQIWHLLTDERSRNAVEVAERFNEGEATAEELNAAWAAAWAADAASAAALRVLLRGLLLMLRGLLRGMLRGMLRGLLRGMLRGLLRGLLRGMLRWIHK